MRQALRIIETHKVNPANDQLIIEVLDGPGHGGASHDYLVKLPNATPFSIRFQNGPIGEVGVNGLTHEVLLAIVIDRLERFQKGPYACRENADAIIDLNRALLVLKNRTAARMARGVEGTHEK